MDEKSQGECLAQRRCLKKHGDFCNSCYYYTPMFSTGALAPEEPVSCLCHVCYSAFSIASGT